MYINIFGNKIQGSVFLNDLLNINKDTYHNNNKRKKI